MRYCERIRRVNLNQTDNHVMNNVIRWEPVLNIKCNNATNNVNGEGEREREREVEIFSTKHWDR